MNGKNKPVDLDSSLAGRVCVLCLGFCVGVVYSIHAHKHIQCAYAVMKLIRQNNEYTFRVSTQDATLRSEIRR